MPGKIVITDHPFHDCVVSRHVLGSAGYTLQVSQCITEEQVIGAARDAAGLLVQWAPISKRVVAALPNCRVMVQYGRGMENIDVDAARAAGIIVCDIPNYCVREVADHTMAMALSLIRRSARAEALVASSGGKYHPNKRLLPLERLNWVTLGFDETAQQVLKRANIFGCSLFTCDDHANDADLRRAGTRRVSLEEAFALADVLSLHLSLSPKNYHIVNGERLRLMEHDSILLNTARRDLVDARALAVALEDKRIGGAGIDVREKNPMPDTYPLHRAPNLILTSHIGWHSEEHLLQLQHLAAYTLLEKLASVEAITTWENPA